MTRTHLLRNYQGRQSTSFCGKLLDTANTDWATRPSEITCKSCLLTQSISLDPDLDILDQLARMEENQP